jgi:hypothetical protein
MPLVAIRVYFTPIGLRNYTSFWLRSKGYGVWNGQEGIEQNDYEFPALTVELRSRDPSIIPSSIAPWRQVEARRHINLP